MILLVYRRKNVVESVLPCGMPCVMFCVFDFACCVCVDCFRFVKKDLMKVVALLEKLNSCFSLCSSFSCDIVSYAFDRSMYIASVGFLASRCLCMLFMMVCSASVVLEFGLKAYCVGEMMSLFIRCVMICLLVMVSSILPMIGRSEIGR